MKTEMLRLSNFFQKKKMSDFEVENLQENADISTIKKNNNFI